MDIILYFFLGFLDSLAIFAIMYRIYRIPFFEDIRLISIMSIFVAISSYLTRIVIGYSELDIALQIIWYFLFLTFVIRIRPLKAFVIASFGYWTFSRINIIVAQGLMASGILGPDFINNPTESGVYIMQVATEVVVFLVAYLLYAFNLGYSYVINPPHDFFIKDKWVWVDVAIFIVAVIDTILFVGSFILYRHMSFISVSPALLIPLIILLILGRKRDYYHARHR